MDHKYRHQHHQVDQLYQFLKLEDFPSIQLLPEAPHRPTNDVIWIIFDYLQAQLTGEKLEATTERAVRQVLHTIGYPLAARFGINDDITAIWPDLVSAMLYMIELLTPNVAAQEQSESETLKLGLINEDLIYSKWQAKIDPTFAEIVGQRVTDTSKELQIYADQLSKSEQTLKTEIIDLKHRKRPLDYEPQRRAQIDRDAVIIEADRATIRHYVEVDSKEKSATIQTALDEVTAALQQHKELLARIDDKKQQLETIISSSGKSLASLAQENIESQTLDKQLHAAIEIRAKQQSEAAAKAKEFLTIATRIGDRVAQINSADLSVPLPLLEIDHMPKLADLKLPFNELQTKTKDLESEYDSLTSGIQDLSSLQRELDRDIHLAQTTKAAVEHQKNELQEIVPHMRDSLQQQKDEALEAEKYERQCRAEELSQVTTNQRRLDDNIEQERVKRVKLERRVHKEIAPLYNTLKEKQQTFENTYKVLEKQVTLLTHSSDRLLKKSSETQLATTAITVEEIEPIDPLAETNALFTIYIDAL